MHSLASATLDPSWFSQVGEMEMIQIFFSPCTTKFAYNEWLRYNANPARIAVAIIYLVINIEVSVY